VLLLLAGIVIMFLRAVVRRRRLGSGTPPQQVLGAWDDVLDTLRLAGRPPPPHLAASGVAAHAAEIARSVPGGRHSRGVRPPVPPLDDLAAKVNAVGFGAPNAAPDDIGAHTARVLAVSYAKAVRARRPLLRRLLWTVDPRPLLRRRR
jgi:hypothetical protein